MEEEGGRLDTDGMGWDGMDPEPAGGIPDCTTGLAGEMPAMEVGSRMNNGREDLLFPSAAARTPEQQQ